ncbi:hypothetical protein [Candidatus Aalborgicola defluviihabitans]|uniref:hypothetical protein n=1 Tax=Candidatus Aalborgicola defluviihabitans TaxID=3386187 RepID=UPI0039B86A91
MAITVGPFAFGTSLVILLVSAAVAALVGYFVGRRQKVTIGATLADMLLAGALAARIAFVVAWFDIYRSAPWSMLDIRDGGFTPWAGALGAVIVALWQGWRRAALRGPLTVGLLAGSLIWTIVPAMLRMGTGPALSDLEEVSLKTLQGTLKARQLGEWQAFGRQPVGNLVPALPPRDAGTGFSAATDSRSHFCLCEPG